MIQGLSELSHQSPVAARLASILVKEAIVAALLSILSILPWLHSPVRQQSLIFSAMSPHAFCAAPSLALLAPRANFVQYSGLTPAIYFLLVCLRERYLRSQRLRDGGAPSLDDNGETTHFVLRQRRSRLKYSTSSQDRTSCGWHTLCFRPFWKKIAVNTFACWTGIYLVQSGCTVTPQLIKFDNIHLCFKFDFIRINEISFF